jgi:DNA-binding CsgD family transcriptional regulator/GAF domain-containing protein
MTVATAPAQRAPLTAARRRRQLKSRVDRLLDEAEPELGVELPRPGGPRGPLDRAGGILSQVTWTALAQLEQRPRRDRRAEGLTDLALRANDLEDEVRRHLHAERSERSANVERALTHLRRLSASAELLDRVCEQIVNRCDFTRSMLSRVDADHWYPWMVHYRGDPDSGHNFVRWMRGRSIAMEELTLERKLVADKRPELVLDAADDARSYQPLVVAGQLTSYVVSPIIAAGRVIGFLHADHGMTGREVDVDDRNVLWVFAEGFGRLYERVVLLERIRAQHRSVRDTFQIAETIAASVANADIELEFGGTEAPRDEHDYDTPDAPAEIDELLTFREKEVLTLMVRGLPNAVIAERLVIKVGTVKSHVKHILRKLGAVNRAAAISKYLGAGVR